MRWAEKYHIKAALYTGFAGMGAGYALVELLDGRTSPSGHLPDTWAIDYYDYPSAANFMNYQEGDEVPGEKSHGVRLFYEEDIYVGYRYFDTFEMAGPVEAHASGACGGFVDQGTEGSAENRVSGVRRSSFWPDAVLSRRNSRNKVRFDQLRRNPSLMDAFIGQMTIDELCVLNVSTGADWCSYDTIDPVEIVKAGTSWLTDGGGKYVRILRKAVRKAEFRRRFCGIMLNM